MRPTLLLICISTAIVEVVYSSEQPKRHAPLGFTGVRGKKSITDEDAAAATSYSEVPQSFLETNTAPQVNSDGNLLDKRAPSGFMGMRGKKPSFPDPDEFPAADGVIKRTPSGFLGMRGKKYAELDNLDDYSKRGTYGFMGMRGKKEFETDENVFDAEKRAPSGFMGMRGKKPYESYIDDIKRAQMSGFFGMRGKKSRSGFFGMRGKKYPYEFRGKFVGVRGKKSNEVAYPYENAEYVQNSGDNAAIDLDQLMLLLANNRPTLDDETADIRHV